MHEAIMRMLSKLLKIFVAGILLFYIGCIVYSYWPHKELPRENFISQHDRLIQVNGHQIRYRAYHKKNLPDKPALLFIHGFAGSLYTWRKVAPQLAETYNVYALDLPGYGLSDKPTGYDYGNESQAELVSGFVAALGLENVAVAGHSMGGPIAVHVSRKNPSITRLILIDAGIVDTGVPAFTKYSFFPFPRMSAKMFSKRDFRKKGLLSSFYNKKLVTDEVVDNFLLASRVEGYMKGTTAIMGSFSPVDELQYVPKIKIPTLIIWGEADKHNPPSNARTLNNMIKNSRLVIVKEAGHYVHEEKPESVIQAIKNFLTKPAGHSQS